MNSQHAAPGPRRAVQCIVLLGIVSRSWAMTLVGYAVNFITVPLFYAMAMGVDALAALFFGRLFDKMGLSMLAAVTARACGRSDFCRRGAS